MTKTIDVNEKDPSMCFVNYFEKYMKSAHGIDLINFNKNNFSKEQKSKIIFDISEYMCTYIFHTCVFKLATQKTCFHFTHFDLGVFVVSYWRQQKTL